MHFWTKVMSHSKDSAELVDHLLEDRLGVWLLCLQLLVEMHLHFVLVSMDEPGDLNVSLRTFELQFLLRLRLHDLLLLLLLLLLLNLSSGLLRVLLLLLFRGSTLQLLLYLLLELLLLELFLQVLLQLLLDWHWFLLLNSELILRIYRWFFLG